MYWYIRVRTYLSTSQCLFLQTNTYQSVLTPVIIHTVRSTTYVSVLVCTALVQGSTRRYKAVPSDTKEAQGGTKRYQNGIEQYRMVHTGTYWSDFKQNVLVHTGKYCFVLIFLLNQVILFYWIPCCNAAWLEVLYLRSM